MLLEVISSLVRCVHPGIDGHVSFVTLLKVDCDAGLPQSYMGVEDLAGRVLNPITEYGCDLTALGNHGKVSPAVKPVLYFSAGGSRQCVRRKER
ncbi:MAG: hypothetical protein ICCCNLDF_02292 [Planctomycetes bacterium]|nr:hypothetical protein [Planctomycetota bacterium]